MRYAASRHGYECVTTNGTTERYAPLPSPGRGRWREAPDEGPFCEAKRWGVSPIERALAVIAPHQSAALRETAAASCLAEARSRRGSGLPPAAHSLPRPCFAAPGEANRCAGTGDGNRGVNAVLAFPHPSPASVRRRSHLPPEGRQTARRGRGTGSELGVRSEEFGAAS